MLRRSAWKLCSSPSTSSSQVSIANAAISAAVNNDAVQPIRIAKDYVQIDADRKALAKRLKKELELEGLPLRYKLIETPPGTSLATVKLKYLVACRRHHPECGGDPEMFLRVSLAYQDVLKDYGLEYVNNRVVNLGNFQACSYQAHNYLEERAKLPMLTLSTLDDHIKQIEEAKAKVGEVLALKLAANDTEAMWLLEDIETKMDDTREDRVVLSITSDNQIKISAAFEMEGDPLANRLNDTSTVDQRRLDDGRQEAAEQPKGSTAESVKGDNAIAGGPAAASTDNAGTPEDQAGAGPPPPAAQIVYSAEVTLTDLLALTAKHKLEDRPDIAGMAARAATGLMNNTMEKKQLRVNGAIAFFLWGCIFTFIYVIFDTLARMKANRKASTNPLSNVDGDNVLPWWGNDVEYEAQVKRIFVQEWKNARSSAQRQKVFQEGVSRESKALAEKETLDLAIFTVTAEKLRQMKENADATTGRR